MGLGKTLSMISLIAHGYNENGLEDFHANTTLLVVPASLLPMWDNELLKHVKPNTLSWRVYHGPRRNINVEVLLKYNIVLTTYSVVASEWKSSDGVQSPLFSAEWHRIVLDEGIFPLLKGRLEKY